MAVCGHWVSTFMQKKFLFLSRFIRDKPRQAATSRDKARQAATRRDKRPFLSATSRSTMRVFIG